MLNAAGQVGEQLLAATPALAGNVPGALGALDATLATTVDSITQGVQANLAGLAPPEEIVRGLVEPLAQQLNRGLNGVLAGAEFVAENGLPNLQSVIDGASGTVRKLVLLMRLIRMLELRPFWHRHPMVMCMRGKEGHSL
jgi:hypothetical protein